MKNKKRSLSIRIAENFKCLRKAMKEYNEENNTSVSMDEFLHILNYTDDDIQDMSRVRKRRHKKKRLSLPGIPNPRYMGNPLHPDYQRYCTMALEFRDYVSNQDIQGKKTLSEFMNVRYGLKGDDAVPEMTNIQNIVYGRRKREIGTRLRT